MQNLDHVMMDAEGNVAKPRQQITVKFNEAQLRKDGAIACMVEFLNFLADLKAEEGVKGLEMDQILALGIEFLKGVEEIEISE